MNTKDLNELNSCLKQFNSDLETNNIQCGNFSIAGGGYDLDWELYYQNVPIVDCIDNTIIMNDFEISINKFGLDIDKLSDTIKDYFKKAIVVKFDEVKDIKNAVIVNNNENSRNNKNMEKIYE